MSPAPSNPARSVATVDDAYLAAAIGSANRRIVFLAPGVSESVAVVLSAAWQRLGATAVSIILDVDPEVCRLGYGDDRGLALLQAVATKVGQTLCHEPGVRIGLLIADDRTVIYSPTPLLIESQPSSKPEEGQLTLSPSSPRPNAVVLGEPPARLADELGVGYAGVEGRSVGLDAVHSEKLRELHADLERNPPLKFDIARYERIFNARIEFVELEVQGCSISRHTASIPSDLMGLAGDVETGRRLRSTFKVISEGDAVDDAGKLSEKTIVDERKRIAEEYLISLPNYGTVILRSNRQAFEREIKLLKEKVKSFGEGLKARLGTIIDGNVARLVAVLLPSAVKAPPARWKRLLGSAPTEAQCHRQLEHELRTSFGSVDALVGDMKVSLLFKGVTYPTLVDTNFIKLVKQRLPGLELMDEYNAARGNEPEKANAKPGDAKR